MSGDIRGFFMKGGSKPKPKKETDTGDDKAGKGGSTQTPQKSSPDRKRSAEVRSAAAKDEAIVTPSPDKKLRATPETKPVVTSKFFSGSDSKRKARDEGSSSDDVIVVDEPPVKTQKVDREEGAADKEVVVIKEEKVEVNEEAAKRSPVKSPEKKKKEDAKSPEKKSKAVKEEEKSQDEPAKRKLPGWISGDKDKGKEKPEVKKEEKEEKKVKKIVPVEDDDDDEEDFRPGRRKPKEEKTPPKKEEKKLKEEKPAVKPTPPKGADGEEPVKKKFNPYNQERKIVPNKDMKDTKIAENKGADNCLGGKTFVITGVLDSMEREEATELIKSYGGRVTGGVSGKTDYVIAGDEPGETKISKAKSLGKKVISEDELFAIIKASAGSSGSGSSAPAPKMQEVKKQTPPKKKETPVKREDKAADKGKQPAGSDQTPKRDEGPQLWVDKHKPNKMEDLCGNGEKVKQLRTWLSCWGKSSDMWDTAAGAKTGMGKPKDDGRDKKAALLTGPPGIGKTTTARLIIAQCGYDMVEMNASDVRNKAGLQGAVEALTTNQSLAGFFSQKKDQQKLRKTCLVMDEVDGMSGGDRGGMQELITLIKATRVPIICIANDYYDRKIGSLKNHCYDLKYGKPNKVVVVKRLMDIAKQEGLNVPNSNALEKLLESANGDIRHVINAMQTWSMRTDTLVYGDVAQEVAQGGKEAGVMQASIFDVMNDWFFDSQKHTNAKFGDRLDMFFFDNDLIPLLVQENYLKVKPALPPSEMKEGELHVIERMAEAAESISDADFINNDIRKNQHWALLPCYGALSTVRAGLPIRGNPPTFFSNEMWRRTGFTKALGHMSTMNKKFRLLSDIERCMKSSASANRTDVACEYLPVLRQRLSKPLIDKGQEGLDEVISLMDEYYFTKEELDSINTELRLPTATDLYATVDSKVKAALTRKYNKESHKIAFVKVKGAGADTAVRTDSLIAKNGAGAKNIGRSGDMEKEDVEIEEEEEGGEDEEEDGKQKPAPSSGKGGGSSASKGGAGSSKGGSKGGSGKGGGSKGKGKK